MVKNKDLVIQKAGKGNNIVVLHRSDHISKLSKILENTSKFRRVNTEERKVLNHSSIANEVIRTIFFFFYFFMRNLNEKPPQNKPFAFV